MTRSWRKVERFLLRLQGRGVQSEEDKMMRKKKEVSLSNSCIMS